jgi:LysR family transcriptional regulator, glycine cleavage system transcriptional activator
VDIGNVRLDNKRCFLIIGMSWIYASKAMAERLPPLNALRTFEAAARHLSFTKAAAELFVTQAAVSHQIKALEEYLGMPLFRRLNRALMLTDEGQALLPHVRGAFDQLAEGVRQLRQRHSSGVLTISVLPSLATTWLIPRLRRFQSAHPEIEVHMTATERLVDFAREPVDAGIRYGLGSWPGLRAERLLSADMIPVCSPQLLDGPQPLRTPEDLVHHQLLHVLNAQDDWRMWLTAAGVKGVDPDRGLRFDHTALAIQAALNGMGVAMGPSSLVGEDLASGRLVEPFDLELPTDSAYYFVVPEAAADQAKVKAFRRWLLEEAAASRAQRHPDTIAAMPERGLFALVDKGRSG